MLLKVGMNFMNINLDFLDISRVEFPSAYSFLHLKPVLQLFSTLIWCGKKSAPDFRSRLKFSLLPILEYMDSCKSQTLLGVSFLFCKIQTFDSYHFPAGADVL